MNDKKEMYSNIVEQNEKNTVDNDNKVERMDDNCSNTIEQNEKEIDRMDVEDKRIDETSGTNECDICKSDEAKNECGKCGKNFCSECEFKLNRDGVIEFCNYTESESDKTWSWRTAECVDLLLVVFCVLFTD